MPALQSRSGCIDCPRQSVVVLSGSELAAKKQLCWKARGNGSGKHGGHTCGDGPSTSMLFRLTQRQHLASLFFKIHRKCLNAFIMPFRTTRQHPWPWPLPRVAIDARRQLQQTPQRALCGDGRSVLYLEVRVTTARSLRSHRGRGIAAPFRRGISNVLHIGIQRRWCTAPFDPQLQLGVWGHMQIHSYLCTCEKGASRCADAHQNNDFSWRLPSLLWALRHSLYASKCTLHAGSWRLYP